MGKIQISSTNGLQSMLSSKVNLLNCMFNKLKQRKQQVENLLRCVIMKHFVASQSNTVAQ